MRVIVTSVALVLGAGAALAQTGPITSGPPAPSATTPAKPDAAAARPAARTGKSRHRRGEGRMHGDVGRGDAYEQARMGEYLRPYPDPPRQPQDREPGHHGHRHAQETGCRQARQYQFAKPDGLSFPGGLSPFESRIIVKVHAATYCDLPLRFRALCRDDAARFAATHEELDGPQAHPGRFDAPHRLPGECGRGLRGRAADVRRSQLRMVPTLDRRDRTGLFALPRRAAGAAAPHPDPRPVEGRRRTRPPGQCHADLRAGRRGAGGRPHRGICRAKISSIRCSRSCCGSSPRPRRCRDCP